MATQEASFHSQHVTPFKYSNRVLLKTLFKKADGGIGFTGQRVVVGGWVKSSKEFKKSSPPPALADDGFDEIRNKDVSCVEILQSRIPLIRSIFEVLGGIGHAPRKKLESKTPKASPLPQPSTVFLLLTDGSCVASLQVLFILSFIVFLNGHVISLSFVQKCDFKNQI